MDLITQTYFKKFLESQRVQGGPTTENFEKFINHLVFSSKNSSAYDLMSTCIGGGDDAALDGFALIINNRFISNMTELKDLIERDMNFEVEFHFIQSKISEAFETKEIGNFGNGVVDMFAEEGTPKKRMNQLVIEKYKMIQYVLSNYEYTTTRKCILYYITPGTYLEDDNHKATMSIINERLLNLEIFKSEDIQLNILGKDYIRKQYEKSKVQNTARFQLNNKIELPYIEDVSEAYFAIMSLDEFFNIIIDEEDGNIRKGIFELNVRDFGGFESNRVNQDIQATIDSDNKESFGLLNNGITIVGSSLSKIQGKYTLKNFYIVNGCQTTNVLYENREKINPSMWISVKFVVTEKSDIIKDIVKATNNQTEVNEIQLLSMDEYQEYLESYYNSVIENKKLHYERREGQYRGNKDILESDIVTPERQIKSFASIFLGAPHTSSRFIGKLQEDISKRIFVKDDNPIIYYTSALVNFYLEELFVNEKIEHVYKKFHQHILFAISRIVFKDLKKPQHNAKSAMDEYCSKLIEAVSHEKNFSKIVEQAKNTLSLVIKTLDDTEANKNATIVNSILKYIEVGLTEEEINKISYLVTGSENIDWYIVPFSNVLMDGDLRYKLPDRYADLIRLLSSYSISSIDNPILIESYNNLISFEDQLMILDLNDREIRKQISHKIINETNKMKKELTDIIEKSKRY